MTYIVHLPIMDLVRYKPSLTSFLNRLSFMKFKDSFRRPKFQAFENYIQISWKKNGSQMVYGKVYI